MKQKQLAKGKQDYDFKEDNYYSYIVKRKCVSSVQIGNFVLDLDSKQKIVGLEIFNASKVLGISKNKLQNVIGSKIHIDVSDEKIIIELQLKIHLRNQKIPSKFAFEKINESYLKPTEMNLAVV